MEGMIYWEEAQTEDVKITLNGDKFIIFYTWQDPESSTQETDRIELKKQLEPQTYEGLIYVRESNGPISSCSYSLSGAFVDDSYEEFKGTYKDEEYECEMSIFIYPEDNTAHSEFKLIEKAEGNVRLKELQQQIEASFGLPIGSVLFCDPFKQVINPLAKVATLRKRWCE